MLRTLRHLTTHCGPSSDDERLSRSQSLKRQNSNRSFKTYRRGDWKCPVCVGQPGDKHTASWSQLYICQEVMEPILDQLKTPKDAQQRAQFERLEKVDAIAPSDPQSREWGWRISSLTTTAATTLDDGEDDDAWDMTDL